MRCCFLRLSVALCDIKMTVVAADITKELDRAAKYADDVIAATSMAERIRIKL